jgi:hypothetical protein
VIVRIATEGQFRLPDEQSDRLNQLDNDAVAAVEAGDEARFRELFDEMIELVRSQGEQLNDDELVESEIILPPPDTSLEDARGEFTGEGLIPG